MKIRYLLIISMILLILFVSMNGVFAVSFDCGQYGSVSIYEFENSSTITVDKCGINNGTNTNADYVVGSISGDYAISYTGTNSYSLIPFSESLDFIDNFSISFWVKPDEITTSDGFVVKDDQYAVRIAGSYNQRVNGRFYRGGWKDDNTDNILVVNNWTHVIVTYNMSEPEELKIYLNGYDLNLTHSGFVGSGLIENNTNDIYFGFDAGTQYFHGLMDDVVFYNKIINSSEAIQIYEAICVPNWIQQNSSCGFYNGTWDKFELTYYDSNACGVSTGLPADNGTLYDCDYCSPVWECSVFNETCSDNQPKYNKFCSNVSDSSSCCATTNLTSDCVFTGNISDYDETYNVYDIFLEVNEYPYVKVNETYHLDFSAQIDDSSNIYINITDLDGSNLTYNFTYNPTEEDFEIDLTFNSIGDYPFVIWGDNPCQNILGIYQGVFFVRQPYYITINLYEDKNNKSYINNFAYATAEFKDKSYDTNLETFLTPLLFKTLFQTAVFHEPYSNGQAVLTLYEKNTTYILRLFDGMMTFPYTYSTPNITKTYGTNIYLDEHYFDGTNKTLNVYLSEKDIKPYKWLLNWILIGGLVLVFVISMFLFFIIPEYPLISFVFGILFSLTLLAIRLGAWFLYGQ